MSVIPPTWKEAPAPPPPVIVIFGLVENPLPPFLRLKVTLPFWFVVAATLATPPKPLPITLSRSPTL